MTGQQNVFLNNGIQMPMFTFASQGTGQQLNNDVDITDVFAEYFVNDTDNNDNSYNQLFALQASNAPVANPLLAPVPQSAPQAYQLPTLTNPNESTFMPQNLHQQQVTLNNTNQTITTSTTGNIALPTRRGIKTAWHTGGLPNLQGSYQVAGNVLQQQQQAQQTQQQVYAHLAKKMKHDDITTSNKPLIPQQTSLQSTPFNQSNLVQTNNIVDTNNSNDTSSAGSAISGRLGFSMIGGQLALPNRDKKKSNEEQLAPSYEGDTGLQMTNDNSVPATTNVGGIPLPVGVGIRIGGQSGAVHQSQQQSDTSASSSNIAQQSHWGGNASIWSSPGILGLDDGRGGLSEQVIAERRQRNREHAKRSRVRKKFLLESLQEEVRTLQKENSNLRMLIYESIPQHAQKIIADCCKASPLFSDSTDEDHKKVELVNSDFSLIESLSSGQQNFVLSDPRLPDNPIVFASEGFYRLTGYTREQVLGRNCRFLQGPQTSQQSLDVIRTAIANGTDATACLLNYKADGTPFWNQFFIAALRDADNNIVNYVGVQCAVDSDAGTSALEDKVNSVMPLQDKDDDSNNNENATSNKLSKGNKTT